MKIKNTITFRKAEVCDIVKIKDILFSSFREYRIGLPENYSVSDIDNIHSGNYGGSAFVLLRGDTVIGFMVLRPLENDCIELKRLYLTSRERGKGLGRILLKHAINFAQEANYKSMRIETTSKFKEAVALYRKNNFCEMPDVENAPGHDLAFEKIIETKF